MLYKSPEFTKITYEAVDFSISVESIRELRIVFRGFYPEGYDNLPIVGLANGKLVKE